MYRQFLLFQQCFQKASFPDLSFCGNSLTLYQTTKSEPFPKQQILDSTELKEIADDNFKFDDNGRKFSKGVENTVGKGEIARYEQCLLFPTVFSRLVLQARKNQGLFGKGLI